MAENFDLIFGQNASQQYAWSDNDYQKGWETIGSIPPTAAQFDALQRRSDTKLKKLNDELTPLVNADTADSRQPSTTYSEGDIKYSPLLPTGWFLTCTTAGITSASEIVLPTPIAEGDTVTDGEVVWTIRKISSGADIPIATEETNGLMSAADKTKLNGIANNANNYSLPAATGSVRGGVTIGSNISLSGDKISLTSANVTNALGYTPPTHDTTYGVVTPYANGLMSPAMLALLGSGGGIVAASLAANGYVKFANGFIVQWGILGGPQTDNWVLLTATFPIAFARACFSVSCCVELIGSNDDVGSFVRNIKTNSMDIRFRSNPSGRNVRWLALGV